MDQSNPSLVDRIVEAVLYEGYLLYPYRPSVKNRQRWTFGGLYPRSHSEAQGGTDAWTIQTECLVAGEPESVIRVQVRFLHLKARLVGRFTEPVAELPAHAEPEFETVESLAVGGELFQTWQEAVEREVSPAEVRLAELLAGPHRQPFAFPSRREREPLREPDGDVVGLLVREQQLVEGVVELSAQPVEDGLFRLTVQVRNETAFEAAPRRSRDEALMRSLASTHTILHVQGGRFVSLIDPPPQWQVAASACRNVGAWPVLVGAEGTTDTMLSSPIILYDYPQLAPESQGDLFDATEIDEILTLRILTMTDEEKQAMRSVDEQARALLSRTESLTDDQFLGLHGAVRSLRPLDDDPFPGPVAHGLPTEAMEQRSVPESVCVDGVELKPGDRVRLRPRGRADIFDLALDGQAATIESIEQDYEDRIHLAVTVDDDPGRDLGRERQIGHRFFFRPEEVEPLTP